MQQQQQPSQQKQVGLSQVIKQIAQQVANANPGTTVNHVQQILVQLAKQIAQTSDQSTGIQVIKQIESQVSSFPKGRVSQAVIQIAKQQAVGNTTLVTQVMQQAAQQIRTGVPGANALVQVALQAGSWWSTRNKSAVKPDSTTSSKWNWCSTNSDSTDTSTNSSSNF